MNETIKEWLAKADGDFHTASREADAIELPNYDAVCFHAQQCVEKLMKAVLIQRGVVPPRTHDLPQLDQLLQTVCPDWSWPIEELRFVTRAAVDFRYPGEMADADEARESFAICVRLREKLLPLINAT